MRISVIIPCHNAEPYLPQAIGSALDQSLTPHEVIVIDDGSTDASLRVARQYACGFGDRVKVFSEHCHNAPRVRNLGAAAATGDALLFLDADDVLHPHTLEALAEALAPQPNAVAICPWYNLRFMDGRWVQGPPTCAPRRPGQDPLSAWLNGWFHPCHAILWTREAFERAGRWDERCGQNQDGDLMMRALVLGVPVVEAKGGAAFYRRMPEGENLATVTGKRYTAHGVRNLIYVTRKIAWLAEQTGQLSRYRPALRRSFASIAGIAAKHGHRELAQQAQAGVQLYQQPWERLVSWGGQNQLRRAYRAIRRRIDPAPSQGSDVHSDEVRCGLEVADKASSADPDALPPSPPLDHPSVSVVVTSGDAASLERTVEGVLQQLDDVEILIVHPVGNETTEEMDWIRDPRVRHLPSPPSAGINPARNRGMRSVRGEIIALREADDLRGLDALAEQVQRLQREPEDLGLLATDSIQPAPVPRNPFRWISGRSHGRHRTEQVPTRVSGVLFRRSVIASVGFFDETSDVDDPAEYWSRVPRFFTVDVGPNHTS